MRSPAVRSARAAGGAGRAPAAGIYGVFQSAGLLFFAFAGYARIATLGEEVRDPASTIPRAIPMALGITVVIYLGVGNRGAGRRRGGRRWPAARGRSPPPSRPSAPPGRSPSCEAGAAVASLGALLALIAGVGRTTLAMARNADLPRWLASVHPRYLVPDHAEIALAVAIGLLVLTTDLRGAIGFSSFGVLIYYADRQRGGLHPGGCQRRWPRFLNQPGCWAACCWW